VPVTDLWVMPWALVAIFAMPFGLEAWPLAAMGWGVDLVHAVARMVASWPGAVVPTTVMPGTGLLIFALGGLWLAIWQRRWRWLGAPVMLAGLLTMLLVRPPDLLISGDGKTMAARAADGGLYIASPNARGYVADTWWKRDGAAGFKPWPWRGAGADGRLRCDPLGCVYAVGAARIAVVREPLALLEDCADVALVVAPALTRTGCRNVRVIDRRSLMTRGAHAVWLDGATATVRDDRSERGERPWVSYPWAETGERPTGQRRTAVRE